MWSSKYTEMGEWKLKIPDSFWINCECAFRLFKLWRKEYKRTKKAWFHTFYVWVTLCRRGPESCKEDNYLSFVSRAKLRTITMKQGSVSPFFPFPSFSLTPFSITCSAIMKRERFSLPIVVVTCCSHTQAPSTRIRIFSNPQLFRSGYGYRPHVSGKFDSESGKK